MTITVDAIYENGVLRPMQPLALDDHARVRVTVVPEPSRDSTDTASGRERRAEQTLGEWIASLADALPPEAFEGMPTDGASQHDHYIYGTPKRTDLRDSPE